MLSLAVQLLPRPAALALGTLRNSHGAWSSRCPVSPPANARLSLMAPRHPVPLATEWGVRTPVSQGPVGLESASLGLCPLSQFLFLILSFTCQPPLWSPALISASRKGLSQCREGTIIRFTPRTVSLLIWPKITF